MELISHPNPEQMIQETANITQSSKRNSNFIGANTQKISLSHLKEDCIIPVFSKDNESTISHYQFIQKAMEVTQELFPDYTPETPDIRVSHIIKGRIPSAIGKPTKELLEHEKTIYYERCAFVIEIPEVREIVNGNELALTIGGVRAYNQENLYSRKTIEKFKVFIGFQNKVCTNLCVSTDGFFNAIRVASVEELGAQIHLLCSTYNMERHLGSMERISKYHLSEKQFAHFIGKARMYQHLDKNTRRAKFPILLTDSQLNHVVKDYYQCPNFSRDSNGSINLWNLYNLFTEANKSSYIDHNLERNVHANDIIHHLADALQNRSPNWYLHN